jgi:hypothetical protein
MGNENTVFLIAKLLYLIGLHKIQCKSSFIITDMHIHTFREGIKDELTRLHVRLSKSAFESANEIEAISIELQERLGV